MNQDILALYPKTRAELPDGYKAIYEKHYFANRGGWYKTTLLSSRLEGWMHRKVAADVKPGMQASTLEIGAGTLNQLPYEPDCGPYDIAEPFKALFESSPHRGRIRHCFADISEAKATGPYDRITNVAVFEHIMDLPVVVAQSALLLKSSGTLRVGIPNEGTPFWKLGTMVTGCGFRKRYGLSYDVLMRYEHVNTADEIEKVLKIFFAKTSVKVFGLSKWIAFYRFYECAEPKAEVARDYLSSRGVTW